MGTIRLSKPIAGAARLAVLVYAVGKATPEITIEARGEPRPPVRAVRALMKVYMPINSRKSSSPRENDDDGNGLLCRAERAKHLNN